MGNERIMKYKTEEDMIMRMTRMVAIIMTIEMMAMIMMIIMKTKGRRWKSTEKSNQVGKGCKEKLKEN